MDVEWRLEVVEQENLLLRERVAFLEGLLIPAVQLPVEWRLTAQETRVFGALINRDLATKELLMATLYSDKAPEDEADPKIIDVFICKIRRKVTPFGVKITTIWGQGYSLDGETRSTYRVRRAA